MDVNAKYQGAQALRCSHTQWWHGIPEWLEQSLTYSEPVKKVEDGRNSLSNWVGPGQGSSRSIHGLRSDEREAMPVSRINDLRLIGISTPLPIDLQRTQGDLVLYTNTMLVPVIYLPMGLTLS
jgi:hypothetical protein